MATAPAPTQTTAPAAPVKSKKKLIIIIIAAVAVLLLGGGGAALFLMKKNAADAAAAAEPHDGEEAAPAKAAKHDSKAAAPLFVPLDPFTINLADREAERYAQVGITLEIEDSKVGDQIKVMMPAIRNNILLAIADRTAGELLGRDGKARLAERVRREVSRVIGAEVEDEEEEPAAEGAEPPKPARKSKKRAPALPVKAVHFSNFIIQ